MNNENNNNNNNEDIEKPPTNKSWWKKLLSLKPTYNKPIVSLYTLVIIFLLFVCINISNINKLIIQPVEKNIKNDIHYIGNIDIDGKSIFTLQIDENRVLLIPKQGNYCYILNLKTNYLHRFKISNKSDIKNVHIFHTNNIVFGTEQNLIKYSLEYNKLKKLKIFKLNKLEKIFNKNDTEIDKISSYGYHPKFSKNVITDKNNYFSGRSVTLEYLNNDTYLLCDGYSLQGISLNCWFANFSNNTYESISTLKNDYNDEEFYRSIKVSRLIKIKENIILLCTISDNGNGYGTKMQIQVFDINKKQFINSCYIYNIGNYNDIVKINDDLLLVSHFKYRFLQNSAKDFKLDIYSFKYNRIINSYEVDKFLKFRRLNENILISDDLDYIFKIDTETLLKSDFKRNIPFKINDYSIFPINNNKFIFIENRNKKHSILHNFLYKIFIYEYKGEII